jgi:hypothetical protein
MNESKEGKREEVNDEQTGNKEPLDSYLDRILQLTALWRLVNRLCWEGRALLVEHIAQSFTRLNILMLLQT